MSTTILLSAVALLQSPVVMRGQVRDTTGAPVAGALVATPGAARRTWTDARGAFALSLGDRDSLVIAARIGFTPETLSVTGHGSSVITLRPAPLSIDPILVAAERATSAASATFIRQIDVALRPRESSQELLRLVPGLVIAQHAGGGKAEQIFLRGFDADHGTDVAVSVDGSPVNMVSHAHGQGYADLHWLMPEVVGGIAVRKGPYHVADGDFATAGAVAFEIRDRLGTPASVEVRGASHGTSHVTVLAPIGSGTTERGYLAAAWHRSDGPFEAPQGYERYNLFGRAGADLGDHTTLTAWVSGFAAHWNASGQVPQRAVQSGLISRFGAIDATEGGRTQRQDLNLTLRSSDGWQLRAFAAHYALDLYSNFTFFLKDSVNGDGIRQLDDRIVAGVSGMLERGVWDFGAGLRSDFARVRLDNQRARMILSNRVDARIGQASGFAFARRRWELGRLRTDLGARLDAFAMGASRSVIGHRSSVIANPKLNVAYQLGRATLFANAAGGFHSNDARAAVVAGVDRVLPRAIAAELGARYSWTGGSAALALWRLDLESELVYAGDEGTVEASGRSRRQGVDFEARARLRPWLWADADVSLSRGRMRDEPAGANRIPLAPRVTIATGLRAAHGAWKAAARMRHVGRRPADETGSVSALGYTLAELSGSVALGRVAAGISVDNLFDVDWNEAQFATTSRLAGEEPGGRAELHFTPGIPRSIQAQVRYRF